MPSKQSKTVTTAIVPKRYDYKTINDLCHLIQPSGAKWCLYGVVKFCREINVNCMLIGICDPSSYGKGAKGASCLLYRESFAGTIELPLQIEVGQIIRLHRMKITSYKPESGAIQLKSSNYYSWLLFDSNDDTSEEPIAQSSFSYSFSDDDRRKIDQLRAWLLSFHDDETLHTELDFQYVLPEPKSFNDQSTQTDENKSTNDETISPVQTNDSSDFFSASDVVEPTKKRAQSDHD